MPTNADGVDRRGYYRGVRVRLAVVVFALAIAWIAPVRWPLKLEVYLAIMLAAAVTAILVRASKRGGTRI